MTPHTGLASVRQAVQDEDDHVEHQEDPHNHRDPHGYAGSGGGQRRSAHSPLIRSSPPCRDKELSRYEARSLTASLLMFEARQYGIPPGGHTVDPPRWRRSAGSRGRQALGGQRGDLPPLPHASTPAAGPPRDSRGISPLRRR